ncbi:hypothetical protein AB0J71_46460 [Nonomuraea sp. NPDC049637]|uniref:hypothetical protein n=1 Tax=Nonomuraea sp. NPDC049637 TaxID=3154356 RepID=UPI00344A23D1
MSRDKNAVLRQTYTGEPYDAARQWYRTAGLYNGLVPDAVTPQQQGLEAALLRALARPLLLWPPAPARTFFGLAGVSPDLDRLLLRPARGQAARLLAQVLPAATAERLSGVPGLRAHPGRRTGVSLAQLTGGAIVAVAGGRADMREAAAMQRAAGAEPLWVGNLAVEAAELLAQRELLAGVEAEEIELWSQALRRAGLFMDEQPDWGVRAPSRREVEGPRPEQIRARPIGGRERVRGVVAVISGNGRGGLGCTTSALALAAALARGGTSVALLGFADDHSGLHRFGLVPPSAPGQWQDLTAELPITVGLLADARDVALDDARGRADVVVVDAGFRLEHQAVLDAADAVIALAPDSMPWTSTELVDLRPDWVQLMAWLDERFAGFTRTTPMRHLLNFLDLAFSCYVLDRDEDGDPAVYDIHDPGEVDEWWGDSLPAASIDADDVAELVWSADELLEDGEADRRAWRQDFLAFLQQEGQRRHPGLWQRATRHWMEAHDEPDGPVDDRRATVVDADYLEEFLAHIDGEAVQRWGEKLWQDYHPVWAAALEAGDDLTQSYDHLLLTRHHPLAPAVVAHEITRQLRPLPVPVDVILISRTTNHISPHQLAEVREVLREDGVADVRVMPHSTALASLMHDGGALTRQPAAARGAADHLAHVVATVLRT